MLRASMCGLSTVLLATLFASHGDTQVLTTSPNEKAQSNTATKRFTLDQALRYAIARSPQRTVIEATAGEARGRLTQAETFPANPVLSAGAGSRKGGGQRSTDLEASLSQDLYLFGQRGNQVDAAKNEYSAARARMGRDLRLLAAGVHLSFIAALEARDTMTVAKQDLALAARLFELAERRLERGGATQLDVNVAAAELGRSEARHQSAVAAYVNARARLAESMGLSPGALPEPAGSLRANLPAPGTAKQHLDRSRDHRGDLRALAALEKASRKRHDLARSRAWPVITVSAYAEREADTDTIFGGGVSVPLPIFNRNQGPIEATRANAERARAERESGQLSVEREVIAAHAQFVASRTTAGKLRQRVVGTLASNLTLLERAFDAGKKTWPEVLVIRRSFVDAQRNLIAAEADARRAWIALEVASGHLPIPKRQSATGERP